jgi:hypothetical protein
VLSVTGKFIHLANWDQGVQVVELRAASETIDGEATRLCAGLTDQELAWSPTPRRWSILQNLAHLRTTTEVFLPAVDAALATTRNLNLTREGPFRPRAYGRVMVWHMESRYIKLRAPKALRPHCLDSASSELQNYLLSQAAVRQRMESAEGLHLTALRVPSPIAKYVRINLLEFFLLFNAHARRHIRQASNLRQVLLSSQRRSPHVC